MFHKNNKFFTPYPFPTMPLHEMNEQKKLFAGKFFELSQADKDKYEGVTFLTYDYSVYFNPNPKENQNEAEDFLLKTSHLDRILPSMMTPNVKNNIIRIFVAHHDTRVIRVYPGHDINEQYNIKLEQWSNVSVEEESARVYKPTIDSKSGRNNYIITVGKNLVINDKPIAFVGIDVDLKQISAYYEEVGFMKGKSVILTSDGDIVYYPWRQNDQAMYGKNVLNQNDKQHLKEAEISNDLWDIITKSGKSSNVQIKHVPFENEQNYTYNISLEFISSTEQIHKDKYTQEQKWDFVYILYVSRKTVEEISNRLQEKITQQKNLVIFITIISSVFTIAIVVCICYKVALSISNPLRKLIDQVHFLNKLKTQNNEMETYQPDQDEHEAVGQVGELVQAFKNLLEVLDDKNQSKNIDSKVTPLQYPPNQYETNFVSKTKGTSIIDWHSVIEEVQDVPQQEPNLKKNEKQKFS